MISAEIEQLRADAEAAAANIREPAGFLSLCAAYHVRFENIHPFVNGNGRTGRELMAEQVDSCQIMRKHLFLAELSRARSEYQMAFSPIGYERAPARLYSLLSRIAGCPIIENPAGLAFPTRLVFPARKFASFTVGR